MLFDPTKIATPSSESPIKIYPKTKIVFNPKHNPSIGAIRHPTNYATPTRALPVTGVMLLDAPKELNSSVE